VFTAIHQGRRGSLSRPLSRGASGQGEHDQRPPKEFMHGSPLLFSVREGVFSIYTRDCSFAETPIILVDNPYQSAANIDTTQEQAYSKTLYPKQKGFLCATFLACCP
jgi:hypothetical protein